jgi:hypothetical protein
VKAGSGVVRVQKIVAVVIEAVVFATLWALLSVEAGVHWLVGRRATLAQRSRAQATTEIVIGMAILGVIGLAVWRVIGPAILAKANGIAIDLQTSGTGATGTGN